MNTIFVTFKHIMQIAFAIVPGTYFLLLLPFVIFVALVKFIKAM